MLNVSFVTLFDRQDLLTASVKFLNKEWPRSDGSREHSQKKSCRMEPPMAFLLIDHEDKIIGHARICLLPTKPRACWIESVMIDKARRGQKFGKMIMKNVEEWMLAHGFTEAYLSTEDQVEFYKKCGYAECQPILHSTTATSIFPFMENLQDPLPPFSKVSVGTMTLDEQWGVIEASIPIPPPMPKPMKEVASKINKVHHQFMYKRLK